MRIMSIDYGHPIGQVLGDGFRVPELLPGWTALEGIVLVKCLDAEGHPSWAFRETEGMNIEEVIGVLRFNWTCCANGLSMHFGRTRTTTSVACR